MSRTHLLIALACLLAAAPMAGQTADGPDRTSLEPGAWSLSFGVPGYQLGEQAEVGVWRMVGARTSVGLTLAAGAMDREAGRENGSQASESGHEAEVGLKARRYLREPRTVTPFLEGGVHGYRSASDAVAGDRSLTIDAGGAGAHVAVGAEWFLLRSVSISGQAGLRARRTREERHYDGAEEETATITSVGTFTSILSLQIYL